MKTAFRAMMNFMARMIRSTIGNTPKTAKPDILARLRGDFGGFVMADASYEEIMREAGLSSVE